MDLFIKIYLNLIVLSFFTGLFITAFRRRKDQKSLVKEPECPKTVDNRSSLQNNMEFFGGIDVDRIQNIVEVSEESSDYDVPVIYAVVDVQDTADQRSL